MQVIKYISEAKYFSERYYFCFFFFGVDTLNCTRDLESFILVLLFLKFNSSLLNGHFDESGNFWFACCVIKTSSYSEIEISLTTLYLVYPQGNVFASTEFVSFNCAVSIAALSFGKHELCFRCLND